MKPQSSVGPFHFLYKERMSAANLGLWSNHYFGVSEKIGGEFTSLFVVQAGMATAYISQDAARLWEQYSAHYLEPGFRGQFLSESRASRERFDRLYRRFTQESVSDLSNGLLVDYLEDYGSCYYPVAVYFDLTQEEFTQPLYLHLRKGLAEAGFTEIDSLVSCLLSSPSPDKLVQEELDLIDLSLEGFSKDDLFRHSIAYSLLFYNSLNMATNLAFLQNRIQEFKKDGDEALERRRDVMRQKFSNIRMQQEQLIQKIGSDSLTEAALLLRDLGVERLELKNSWAGAEYRFLGLFQEIARRLALPLNGMMASFSVKDMAAALEGNPYSLEELSRKRELYLYHSHSGKTEPLFGSDAEAFIRRHLPGFFDRVQKTVLEGNTASGGLVSANAFVVFNAGIEQLLQDTEQFKPGSILVTSMTQPNMMVLAKKAAGIVTDEGGITSHAAVISRELGIPCVVGTHDATRAIRTGDWLDLDATGIRGKVRILPKPG